MAWSYQAAQGEEPNFWPLGATFLAVGCVDGTAVVALLGRSVRDQPTLR